MPFTPSHAAAVLVLLGRPPLVGAALIAGSMAPDVPYFLPVDRSAEVWWEPLVNASTSHSASGLLTIDLLFGVVLLLAWAAVRAPVAALWPRMAGMGAARVMGAGRRWSPEAVGWTVASFVLGAASHIAWDACTHGDGAVVGRVSLLRTEIGGIATFRVLQHLSTVVGLVLVAWWVQRHLPAGPGSAPAPLARWIGAALVAAAAVGATARMIDQGSGATTASVAPIVKGGGTGLAVGLFAYAAGWHLVARRRRLRSPERQNRPAEL